MATLGTFTSGSILSAAELNAIADQTSFTPAWTGITVGNGTNTGFYYRINNIILVQATLVFGSTTSVTASVFLDFPETADNFLRDGSGGQVMLEDDDGSIYYGPTLRNNSTSFGVRVWNSSATYLTSTALSSTVPFTWATNDRLVVNHWFQAA